MKKKDANTKYLRKTALIVTNQPVCLHPYFDPPSMPRHKTSCACSRRYVYLSSYKHALHNAFSQINFMRGKHLPD